MGDAAGIGPEVIVKALASRQLKKKQNYLVIGNKSCLRKTAQKLKLKSPANILEPSSTKLQKKQPPEIRYIDFALELIKKGQVRGLATGPVNKEVINKAGINFTGHTEYLASKAGVKLVVMMLVGGGLKTALITTHMALKEVGPRLNRELIIKKVMTTNKYLKKLFRIKNPKIGVAALNPHAGEGGVLGLEEKNVIQPAIDKLKKQIPGVCGALPADSGFYKLYHREYDILVCMYHDQAMIPVKMLARDSAVNVTLGLPYVRTSPVHGTAYDIAGKGKADPSSMISAMNLALQLAQ